MVMYKILTSKVNEHGLNTVLLHSKDDYMQYIKDKNFVSEDNFKDVLFKAPESYPVILVTHFEISFNKYINHTVYGEFIYPHNFDM